jgi:hypothetical protein
MGHLFGLSLSFCGPPLPWAGRSRFGLPIEWFRKNDEQLGHNLWNSCFCPDRR